MILGKTHEQAARDKFDKKVRWLKKYARPEYVFVFWPRKLDGGNWIWLDFCFRVLSYPIGRSHGFDRFSWFLDSKSAREEFDSVCSRYYKNIDYRYEREMFVAAGLVDPLL